MLHDHREIILNHHRQQLIKLGLSFEDVVKQFSKDLNMPEDQIHGDLLDQLLTKYIKEYKAKKGIEDRESESDSDEHPANEGKGDNIEQMPVVELHVPEFSDSDDEIELIDENDPAAEKKLDKKFTNLLAKEQALEHVLAEQGQVINELGLANMVMEQKLEGGEHYNEDYMREEPEGEKKDEVSEGDPRHPNRYYDGEF